MWRAVYIPLSHFAAPCVRNPRAASAAAASAAASQSAIGFRTLVPGQCESIRNVRGVTSEATSASSSSSSSARRGAASDGVDLPPLALVLDIDETLLRPKIIGVPGHKNRQLRHVDFRVTIKLGDGLPCDICLRPGVKTFFDWVRKTRSAGLIEGPWLFTQGARPYVEALLTKLDPDGDLFSDRVLSQEMCMQTKTPGYVLKDLSRVPIGVCKDDPLPLSRVILVDNNAMSAILCPENVLMVRDWRGAKEDNAEDAELQRVSDLLDEVIASARAEALATAEPGKASRVNYVRQMVAMHPRHDRFRARTPELRMVLDGESLDGDLRTRLRRAWDTADMLKRELLDLAPEER
eukprot:TRINITY_DN62969_c0_g1_i1.p1 TRINITY_DN62969_c0_g1~~TRINITY_DN62969_c0_g1_i1.p1  ORF type:complete len:350 (+),score=57.64 TRINITY_DN62969_c0_g1_i1:198-1247(+)